MRLVKLSANKNTFKTVNFENEFGINLIVAELNEKSKSKKGDTTNGVGKSLLIAIIHFCLGSSKNIEFEEKLPGWIFTLDFKINQNNYKVSRSTANQSKVIFNGKEIKVSQFNSDLEKLLFNIPKGVNYLSFRSLIPFFIRPKKASYTDYKNPNTVSNSYQILLTNSFLLGLNVGLVQEKFKLRTEKERIRKLVKELKNDKFLKNFFLKNKDFTLEVQELEEKIIRLESDLKSFRLAKDYYDIQVVANSLKNELDKIQNQLTLYNNRVVGIEESIKITPDIKRESIENIYKEASVVIKEDALKTMSELEKFYETLSTNRQRRLLLQKEELLLKIKDLKEEKEVKSNILNKNLKYLDTHKALDVFVALNGKLSDLKSKKENILKYHDLLEGYNSERKKIISDFINESVKTDLYLKEAQDVLKDLMTFFRDLSKRFYPNSKSGILVSNNDGDNQTRFNFDAKIEADASDGINSVKIFNYDLTILIKGFSHYVNFLFHDSRLLDGVDPRQKAELFLILGEIISSNNKQYILTLNQNQLEDTKQFLSKEEYEKIIKNNIVLRLKDDSPENKLLGIQVDMHY